MTKGQRILVFLVALSLLVVTYLIHWHVVSQTGGIGVVVFSSLVMLSFTSLLAEHFFTRPTDVVASTLSVLLLISPLYALLSESGIWYWVLWGYSGIFLVVSLVSLLLLDSTKPSTTLQNRASKKLKMIAVFFGNGRFLWFLVFAITTLFFIDNQSRLFVILMLYSAVLLAINPQKAIRLISKPSADGQDALGEIFSIQSTSVFLAKVFSDAPGVNRFSVVGFSSKSAPSGGWTTGLVLETYQLNQQRWLKVLTDPVLSELENKTTKPEQVEESVIYRLTPNEEIDVLSHLIGTICEKSTIEKIKFDYAFEVGVQEGDLIEVDVKGQRVLYQIVEGMTEIESLESRDEAGIVIGEAVQLGTWNPESRSFDRFGWVPQINSPVIRASKISVPQPSPDEYQIGAIPNSNFPVFIDKKQAVEHHLAILGVTGSGKSVFARDLLRQIADEDTKVICVDFTNEYRHQLSDLIDTDLIEEDESEALFQAVDRLGSELDKFPNQRVKAVIDTQESVLRTEFKKSIQSFTEGESKAALFELPDVTNSTGILEYTKWFFRSLFELARADQLNGKRICVVLEEAHTVVPEWNFLGTEDKRPSAVVNSISQIALQGRKYGVGFIVIAQRTANVSKTVLTQCNTVVAFQQFDKTSADFLANHMGADFIDSLAKLKPRHAIAVGKAFSSGTPLIFQVPTIIEPEKS